MREKHGLTNHRLYSIWRNIKARTTLPSHTAYINYGARGICLCDEWVKSFISFYNWAINSGYSDLLTIDRIDNNGNYEPSNCRWVMRTVQSRNTRVLYSTNTSGYRGVYFHKARKLWSSCIRINGKSKTIGYFNTAIESAIAYDSFVIRNNLEHTLNGVELYLT